MMYCNRSSYMSPEALRLLKGPKPMTSGLTTEELKYNGCEDCTCDNKD